MPAESRPPPGRHVVRLSSQKNKSLFASFSPEKDDFPFSKCPDEKNRATSKDTIWINGTLLPAREARIDPRDRGFLLGDGIFETLRAEAGVPLHAARHFARLRASAAFFGIKLPFSETALHDALCALAAGGDAALRLTLTRGTGPRGLLPPDDAAPVCVIAAAPLPNMTPVSAIVASVTRRNEQSPLSRHKTLNYLDGVLARREAACRGAGDALLLNSQGRIAEATAACVFLRIGDAVFTPPVADGALPGIARALLLESGAAIERSIAPRDLADADEVFLANALGRRDVIRMVGVGEHLP